MSTPDAASWAADNGYTRVYAFRGGLPEWIQAGYETVTVEKLPKADIPTIRPTDLKDLLDSGTPIVLLDVRPTIETAKVWIDSGNRLELPFEDLSTRTAEIPKGKRIVIVDVNGKRAPVAGQYLTMKGYDNLSTLDGGMYAWVATDKPVKRGK